MQRAIDKAAAMTDAQIMAVWCALVGYDWTEMYDDEIPMDSWAEIINSERSKRGLPLN